MSIELGNIVSIAKGKKHDNVFPSNGIGKKRYIQIEDLRSDDNLKYTDDTGVDVSENDMIIAWDGANAGTIGFGLNGFIGSTLARLRFKEKGFDTNYLGWFLRSKSDYLRSKCTGATIPHINKSALESLKIPKLDLKTQQEIAHVLKQADKARQERKAANALTDQFLQSSFLSLFGDPVKNEKGWEVKTLEDVCDKITDGTHHSPVNLEAGDYKYITAKNIKEEGILMRNISYVSKEAHKAIYSRCNPEFEDVLYIKDGVTTGIAVVNHLKEEFSMLSSVALLKCNRKILSPYFLVAYLNNDSVYDGIRKNMGGAAITRVTLQKINAIKIILPPLSLQQKFAGIVAQAEQLRQKQRDSERELENLFQGLLQRYFG